MPGLRDKSKKSEMEEMIYKTLRRARVPLTIHELAARVRTDYKLLQVFMTAEFLKRQDIRRVRVEDSGRKLWAYFHKEEPEAIPAESAAFLRRYAEKLEGMAKDIKTRVRQQETIKRGH